jgi:alanine racemase
VGAPSPHGVPGPDPRIAGGRLSIDLGALAENYRLLCRAAGPARVAGVVKADAYGLGIAEVAPVLWDQGCREFFVALPDEGVALRAVLPTARIFVLAGLFEAGSAEFFREADLVPVLNSQAELSLWESFGWDGERPLPCAIHVDTGMNRLGLPAEEAVAFARDNALTQALSPILVMSHLACADDPSHELNHRQWESFQAVRRVFPGIDSSLSNSAGAFLGPDFGFDLVRPGIALYGGRPSNAGLSPMRPVVTAEARVVQIRQVAAGETVSYGATAKLSRDSLIAVAALGYADGYHRSLSGHGVPLRAALPGGGQGWVRGRKVPVVGRVTMDLTMFDVTDLAGQVVHGDWIELFGSNVSIDEAAMASGTIPYEMLTSLGRRYDRHYTDREPSSDG